jgi:hypothetical protein
MKPWLLVIQYGFIFAVPALEYLFPLAAGFFKAELRFLILFVVPPLVYCASSNIKAYWRAATSALNYSLIYNSK